MWQRIQTLFLIVVIASLVGSLLMPIWASQVSESKTHLLYAFHYSIKEKTATGDTLTTAYLPYALTACLMVAAITLAIIEIGRYKNRLLQLKLGALNSLFIAGAMASALYFSYQLHGQLGGAFGFGLWLPFGAVISNFLSNQFIRRDEKLVRDSDRLR
ncbi:DUF4293 domain-containing protein [Pseudochryseolinea flava]|uniref:DUF4293 domain-containing protein n=1 Tax=Pseudochryseolinea flava TaxID=2059302 RepID=A0A364Y7Z7_9BACT|nr:DUF4293 domain-containing protein [Pseudochryseolinea flava]RAW03023.1 hypothetical protein DQQ10_02685 [Pseudochryseolinea flava]